MNENITELTEDPTAFAVHLADMLGLYADEQTLVDVLDVSELSSRDACIVQISATIFDQPVVAQGTSRRNPADRHDPQVGRLLAYSRAYEQLAKKIARRANGLVKHKDDIAAIRPSQRERSKVYKANLLVVASTDDEIQRKAVTMVREQEGTFPSRQCC